MASVAGMVVGVVGCGTISSAVVTGLCTATGPRPKAILLSPRNAAKAAALAESYPGLVRVCSSNQEVVDGADVVLLGLLPKVAPDVLPTLKFREAQTVVSQMAMVDLKTLTTLLAPVPAANICRSCPLPPIARHLGATIVCPKHAVGGALFEAIGAAVQVDTEEQLAALQAITCLMGPLYALEKTCLTWLTSKGIEPATGAKYVGNMFNAVADDGRVAGNHVADDGVPVGFDELIAEQTPGGLNEGAIAQLTQAGVFDQYGTTLDTILGRLTAS